MLEPDFWKGRGRYSKQAISRKTRNDGPYEPPKGKDEAGEAGGNTDA